MKRNFETLSTQPLQRFSDEDDLLERSTNKPKMDDGSQDAMVSDAGDGSSSHVVTEAQSDPAAEYIAASPTNAMPTDVMDSDTVVDSSCPRVFYADHSDVIGDVVAETQHEAMSMPPNQGGVLPMDAGIPFQTGPVVGSGQTLPSGAGRPPGNGNQRMTAGQNVVSGGAQGNVAARGSRFTHLETECEHNARSEEVVLAAMGTEATNQGEGAVNREDNQESDSGPAEGAAAPCV
nr:hypothetical protein Iba_chr09eCG11440 [Ipomoea batatas]